MQEREFSGNSWNCASKRWDLCENLGDSAREDFCENL